MTSTAPEPKVLRQVLVSPDLDSLLVHDAFWQERRVNDVSAERFAEGLRLWKETEGASPALSVSAEPATELRAPRCYFLPRDDDDELRHLAWNLKVDRSDLFAHCVRLSFAHRPTRHQAVA